MSLHENIASDSAPLHAMEVARIANGAPTIRAEHCPVPTADEAAVPLTPCFGLRVGFRAEVNRFFHREVSHL